MTDAASLVIAVDSTSVKDADKALSGLEKQAEQTEQSAAAMGRTIGLWMTAAAGAVVLMSRSAINAADAMNDMHLRTGVSLKDLAAYDELARQSGTSIQGVASGFKNLSRYMTEHGEKLRSIGVDSKDVNVAMRQFADVISKIEDPALRASLAQKVLRSSGTDLLPLLVNGKKAFDDAAASTAEYGRLMEAVAPKADEFNDELEKLKTTAKTAGLSLANDMLPHLTEITKAMSQAAKESGLFTAAWVGLGGVGTALFTDEFDNAAQKIVTLRGELGDLERHREQLDPGKGGVLQKWLYGTAAEVDAKIAATKKSIADLQAQINKPTAPKLAAETKGTPGATDTAVRDLLAGAEAGKKLEEQLAAGREAYQNFWMGVETTTEKMIEQVKQQEFENSLIGKTKVEIAALTKLRESETTAKEESLLATMKANNATTDEINKQEALIAAMKRRDAATKMKATLLASEETAKEAIKAAADAAKAWENFTTNVQRNLGDVLYNGMNGKFNGIADLFKQMLMRMAADAAAANLTQAMFGKGSAGTMAAIMGRLTQGGGENYGSSGISEEAWLALPNYAGGGFSGNGSRSGGVDGMGGFPAILHPQETVIDHASGQSGGVVINDNRVINVDASADRNEVYKNIVRMIEDGNARLVDRLQRQGQLA